MIAMEAGCSEERMPKPKKPSIDWGSPTDLILFGDWTIKKIHAVQKCVRTGFLSSEKTITVNMTEVSKLDSSGALVLLRLEDQWRAAEMTVNYVGMTDTFSAMIQMVREEVDKIQEEHELPKESIAAKVGQRTVEKLTVAFDFLHFFGRVTIYLYLLLLGRFRMQWKMLGKIIESTGFRALPIVALLTFLIGVVITYQSSSQLETYGANIYIVNLTGIMTLREFGPLLTAIILAGRTSTAFTAEIGSMVLNQEVDALRVLGIKATERLVLPKLIGLLLVTPLLVMWANFFCLLGSVVMSDVTLAIAPQTFMSRFHEVVAIKHLWVGLIKTPFFAVIIATVGCFQGFSVKKSSASLGNRTTQSAVQSLFLVIVADAIFSIIFSMAGV